MWQQPDGSYHRVKIFRIRSYSGQYFPAFGLNTVRMGENADQNNFEYGHFLLNVQQRFFLSEEAWIMDQGGGTSNKMREMHILALTQDGFKKLEQYVTK